VDDHIRRIVKKKMGKKKKKIKIKEEGKREE
jgi:hypothetical protein